MSSEETVTQVEVTTALEIYHLAAAVSHYPAAADTFRKLILSAARTSSAARVYLALHPSEQHSGGSPKARAWRDLSAEASRLDAMVGAVPAEMLK